MSKDHTGKNSAVEWFRNKQLTYKISVAVGILLVACLTVMIAISATIAAKFMNSSISGEFDGIAQQNGISDRRYLTELQMLLIFFRIILLNVMMIMLRTDILERQLRAKYMMCSYRR